MSDFNSSLPVRTETNGDVAVKIVDGTVVSQALTVDAAGKIEVKLDDAAGNGITSQVNGAQQALDVGINVAGVQIDPRQIRALTSADTVTVVQPSGANLHVNVDNFPADADALAQGSTTSGQLGALSMGAATTAAPSYTTATTNPLSLTLAGALRTDSSATTQPVSGTVTANQGTSPWVTSVNNLPATVDTNYGTVGASTLRSAAQIGNVTGAADFNNGATGAQTLRVAANLAVAGANVTLANPVPVTIADAAGTHINDFKDATAIAAGASDNHDYTVTALKTLHLNQLESSGSGKAKMEVQIETGVATNVFTSKFVQFNSTSTPNMSIILQDAILVAAGVRVRLIMSNNDKAAQDLYSTISGFEV